MHPLGLPKNKLNKRSPKDSLYLKDRGPEIVFYYLMRTPPQSEKYYELNGFRVKFQTGLQSRGSFYESNNSGF